LSTSNVVQIGMPARAGSETTQFLHPIPQPSTYSVYSGPYQAVLLSFCLNHLLCTAFCSLPTNIPLTRLSSNRHPHTSQPRRNHVEDKPLPVISPRRSYQTFPTRKTASNLSKPLAELARWPNIPLARLFPLRHRSAGKPAGTLTRRVRCLSLL